MKICLICTRFVKNKMGGVERVTFELAKQFEKSGHEAIILSRKEIAKELSEEIIEGIKIIRINTLGIKWFKTISSFFKLIKVARKISADIYNPQDWSPTLPFIFSGLKNKYVMTSHGFYADYINPNKIVSFFERITLKLAKKPVICVQKRSKTDYIEKFKLTYVPNGVNTDKFKYSRENQNYLLFVGSIDDRKNIEGACAAFRALKNKKGLKFKVVGEGPLREKLSEKYPEIDFLGRKEGNALIELYRQCKFFVLPSTAEGFGLVWLEAMSCGKPIIATSVGAGEDIVLKKTFGRIVKDPSSTKEITEKIEDLNNQIDKKGTKGGEIRKFVCDNYSWHFVVKEYLKIFNRKIRGTIK